MCSATRYPEAIPLRTITAKTVVKALVKFFSTFGLPKVIQTDQGSNFMSKLFSSVLKTLCISHQVSSPYHPESQGALERWHQTLKAMLRKYCMDTSTDWDEGVPFVLFAIRETIQESLGFSPADLVFGHTPRGPLKVLKEHILSPTPSSAPKNVLDYVSKMRERLHAACALAQKSLSSTQKRMKLHYDKKAVGRSFAPGDQVLVLLPIPGSSLSARFSGPYLVEKKLSDTNYVIKTPDRRRSSRMCHVNMLKAYYMRDSPNSSSRKPVQPAVSSVAAVVLKPGWYLEEDKEDGLELRHTLQQCERLCNSEMLKKLPSQMEHLDKDQTKDLILLINSFLTVFQDVPSRTSILEHDVDVGDAVPISQHPYRVNAKKREVMKSEVAYLLQNDMAKPSNSSWSSPCILVPKPDGTSRLCTDYRRVNAVTKSDSFPLPRLDDCIDRIGSAAYVSKLDLLKGYWQVPLTSRASDISAFVTPDNFVQYSVMPFGMCNAPATFQRLVNIVFADVPNCTAYLDDVVIHSSTWSDHFATLKSVFQRLANASLTLNLAKCEFGKATVTYLGKQVGRGQVRPVTGKVEAIVAFPAPTTRRQLRRFLGMVGYYRTFCKNFSTVVAPLSSLLSPKVPF
uniref:ribonuclease H n=1 Tax=Salmo trutta TaxID=8032 RepID=A0A673Y3Q0_SALTR